jgi:HK97 family phage prohead protease
MAMPEIEIRTLILAPNELRASRKDDGSLNITGYAAKFMRLSQDLGGFREQIHPDFFAEALSRCDVRCLRNHDPDHLLGRSGNQTCRLATDSEGLLFDNDLPNTTDGRDTHELISTGRMIGCSFSFTTDADDWDDSSGATIRTLMKCRDLFDVGPVTYPAYLDTSVAARSLERSRLAARSQNPHVPRELKPRLLKLRLVKG